MSEFLKQYRTKFPQYDDLSDTDLVTALHRKNNADTGADMPLEEFNSAIGYAPPAEPVEPQPEQGLAEPVGIPEGYASDLPPTDQPAAAEQLPAVAKASVPKLPEMKAYDPGLWEQIKSLGSSDSNRAKAMNEWAARKIAAKEGVDVGEVYESAGFSRPLLNPEGRPTGQALAEGALIVATQLPDVPQATVNSILRVVRGGDETAEDNFLDEAIKYTEPAKAKNVDKNYANFYGLGKSLGTSLTSLTASIVAGAVTAPTAIGPIPAAMAAGGAVAYRSSKDEFIGRIKEGLDSKSQFINGRPLNQEEWDKALVEYDAAATKYASWEAIPEAVSNLVFMRALALPMKGLSKKGLNEAAGRAAQVMASEQVTETATGVGQSYAEEEAGLGEAKSIREAFRDQALQTGLITLLMGGGAAATKYGFETAEQKISPERVLGRELLSAVDSVDMPKPTQKQIMQLLSPEMDQIKSLPQEEKTIVQMAAEKIFDATGPAADQVEDIGPINLNVTGPANEFLAKHTDMLADNAKATGAKSFVINGSDGSKITYEAEPAPVKEVAADEDVSRAVKPSQIDEGDQPGRGRPTPEDMGEGKAPEIDQVTPEPVGRGEDVKLPGDVGGKPAAAVRENVEIIANEIKTGDQGRIQKARKFAAPRIAAALEQAVEASPEVAAKMVKALDAELKEAGGLLKVVGPRSKVGRQVFDLMKAPEPAPAKAAPVKQAMEIPTGKPAEVTAKFSEEVKRKNPSIKFSFSTSGQNIVLDKIIVPEEMRGEGIGKKAMGDITKLADQQGKTIALTPSTDFGGAKGRLVGFYKGFGFVENKGRNRDYEISESMYREPEAAKPAAPAPEKPAAKKVKPKKSPTKGQDFGRQNYVMPTSEGTKDEIYHAPGHNYVGLHRSTGIPPRQEFVTINGKTVKVPKTPQRIEPINRKLISIIGPRIYNGKIKGKSSEGFYRPDVGEIRTRKKNDVEVLAHEAAHYLDDTMPVFSKMYKSKALSDEVKALSYTDASPKLQQIEGFAEFVRLWLTNAQEARARAPAFYDAFTKQLASDKKLNKAMGEMQELMHKFYFQGADKMGQALIGGERSFLADFDQWKFRRDSRLRQQTIDRFHAARKIEQELTGKIGKTQESAWKQFRLANGGAEGITDYVLNYGTVNFDEKGDLKKTGKSLHDVLEPVKTIDRKPEHKKDSKIDLLMRYFAGRRALELHNQGRENLIPKETAMTWARLGKDYPVFESIHKEFQAFNDRMMDFYVEAGMITPEGRKAMKSMNKDYVPFNRIREGLAGGKGPGQSFQKLKGGTANLNDILVNIQDGIETNIRAALNNKAKQRLYQYISNSKDGAIFAVHLGADSKPVKVHQEEMQAKIGRILEDSGIEIEGELDLTDSELLTFWQHGVKPTVNESGNIVDSMIINGKRKYYEVQDPLMQEMLLSMNPESYGSFMNVMFGVKNFFTRTITLGVQFIGANLVRDTTGATFISKHGFKPFLDSFTGMYSFLSKDKDFQDFMRSGGGYSSRIHANTRQTAARRRVAINEFGVMSIPEKLLSTFDNFASIFEYGTRIGEFKLAKKAGEADMDAGYAGREISTDFSVTGANRFLAGYIRTVPFLNAMIQSQDRVYREALVKKKYDGNPTGMAARAFLGITVPTLILWMLNREDDEYKQIPDHEKRTNWHIPVGETEDGRTRYMKIPRPYDVGFVYATMPELIAKYWEDERGKEFADGMIWTMTQMYGIDGVPAVMTGWWDLVRNEKWTGAPVVPKAMQDVDATEQYRSNTSETFIRLGQALGVSPIKAEHMFKAYTGYLGGYLMWGTDQLMWDEEKFGEKPDRKASDNIFLSRFLAPKVRHSTATMEKFFDLKEQADKVTATFKSTIDTRRAIKKQMDEPGKFKDTFFGLSAKEKEVLFALNDSMNKMVKVIYGREGLRTKELMIRHDKRLSGVEKREQIEQVWRTRNKAFMTYYKEAEKALIKARKESEKGK